MYLRVEVLLDLIGPHDYPSDQIASATAEACVGADRAGSTHGRATRPRWIAEEPARLIDCFFEAAAATISAGIHSCPTIPTSRR